MFGKRKPRNEGPRRRRRGKPSSASRGSREPKGLDAAEVVDRVLAGPNGEARLIMMHSRPWTEGDDARLKRKLGAYLAYIEQGQIDELNAQWFQSETVIELVHMDPIPDWMSSTVDVVGETLVTRYGIGFSAMTFVGDEPKQTVDWPGPSEVSVESAMRGGTAFTMYVATQLAARGVSGLRLAGPYEIQTDDQSLSTQRLWGECKAKGAEVLGTQVSKWLTGLMGEAEVESSEAVLVPLIRHRAMFEDAQERVPSGANPADAEFDLLTPFCGPLVVCYALDRGNRFEYVVSREDLAGGEIPADALPEAAVENLRAVLPELQVMREDGSCYGIAAGGDYEPSLLLLPEVVRQMEERVAGDLVASIPARDLLFLTGSEDEAGLADLRHRVATTELEPGTGLWPGLMVWRNEQWQPFDQDS